MKKLMFIAAAAAMTSAFGVQVADYGAQVAYVDMQKVSGTVNGRGVSILLKYVKTCTIKGYVVYSDCACDAGDARVNPAYLVVKSTAQKKLNTPRIFPAELLVKTWSRSSPDWTNEADINRTIEAEGYLFAGFGKGAYTFDQDFTVGEKQANTLFLDNTRGYAVRPWANNDAIYGDDAGDPVKYWWDERDAYKFGSVDTVSTRFLFGTYNDLTRNADGTTNFYDSWMDHAGFGKASFSFEDQGCAEADHGMCLKTLQGYLIGGLYICYPNGYSLGRWEWFPCHEWYGTTDVVTGLWGMRKFANACPETAIVAADGSFLAGIHFDTVNARYMQRGIVPEEGAYLVNQQKAKPLFGYLKSCVIALGGATNLGFIDAEDASLTTSLLLQDGSRDIWYNVNTTETATDAGTAHFGEPVVPAENTAWEHFFSCSCNLAGE